MQLRLLIDGVQYHLTIKLVIEDGNHLRTLRLLFQLLLMFHKHELHYLDFQHTQSSFQYRMVLNQLDVAELLRNYPNQHEHHVMLEVLREQGDQSKLTN